MNPKNGKQNLVQINCKTQLIRQAFHLIKCYLTIKTEYRKIEMEKLSLEINRFHRAL